MSSYLERIQRLFIETELIVIVKKHGQYFLDTWIVLVRQKRCAFRLCIHMDIICINIALIHQEQCL